MAGRMKHLAATRVERVLRSAYRRLPVASHHRWHIKSAVFRRTGWLMRGTASYQHWQATERRALGNSGGSLVQRLRSDTAAPRQVRLPCSDAPTVSVIVPVFGQTEFHATLPGLHRPPRADDTHRGHRRRRCVAGTDGRRARTNRRTAHRSDDGTKDSSGAGIAEPAKLADASSCSSTTTPRSCPGGATSWWRPLRPFHRPELSAPSCSTPTARSKKLAV